MLPRALFRAGRWWEIAVVQHRTRGVWALAIYDQLAAHRTRRAWSVVVELRGDLASVLPAREAVGPRTEWRRACAVPPWVARALDAAVIEARRSRRSSAVPRPSVRIVEAA